MAEPRAGHGSDAWFTSKVLVCSDFLQRFREE